MYELVGLCTAAEPGQAEFAEMSRLLKRLRRVRDAAVQSGVGPKIIHQRDRNKMALPLRASVATHRSILDVQTKQGMRTTVRISTPPNLVLWAHWAGS